MKRRYRIVGPVGQQDDTGDIIPPGGIITLDDKTARTQTLLELAAITADTDDKAPPATMECPICTEQGKKSVPKLADQDELEAHYTDKHPGFVVPTFTEGGEG